MALSIKSEKADRLARELADLTGESITDAVITAIEDRLDLERRQRRTLSFDDIVERFARLPVLDERSPDEILGYDHSGVPA